MFGFLATMADAVQRLMNSITNDDPETRGQQLWVMFAIALLLVATLNWYAYIREPEVINVEDLLEYKNEVVKIEGTLISWVRDPYSNGDNRIDAIIDDGTGVVENRWYRPGAMPPIGTQVTIMGDVIEYEGRIWIQSLGAGAMEWKATDLPDVVELAIADVALRPADFEGQTIRLTGFIGESIPPGASFTSAYLGDHPTYGNSDHQMHLIIRSSIDEWIEATSKIQVQGLLSYQQRDLRWSLQIQGPDILVDRAHEIQIPQLDWNAEATWSYQSGQLVTMNGALSIKDARWVLTGPDDGEICILPSQAMTDSTSLPEGTVTVQGRLGWSTSYNRWCIDMGEGDKQTMAIPQSATDLLALLSGNPLELLETPTRVYTISAYAKYSVAPSVATETTYLVDSSAYTPGWTSVATTLPGPRTQWIEAGQSIIANVTAAWDDENARFKLTVNEFTLGPPPSPTLILWDDGAIQWGYKRDQRVYLDAKAVLEDDGWFLHQDGGSASIALSPLAGAIGIDELHSNLSMRWVGRLRQVQSDDGLAIVYMFDTADVLDSDGDGLGDTLEASIETSPFNDDSNDNGIDDRTEYLENQ